ncbi:hypothetical protein F9C11_21970 [Amycolatopsis sp. VS8301801F10]|uniref:hypothetical protein n=1 Tax=Amycolatopsis sp. VS8301801F10 TaxID=2652442 RepID=UPI0038FCCAD1
MSSRPRSTTGTHDGPGTKPPGRHKNGQAAKQDSGTAGLRLPSEMPKRALWWGGLAALAAVGVLEWPVAVVVGAGTYVAEKLSREDVRKDAAAGD